MRRLGENHGRIADGFMSVLDRDLAGDDCGAAALTVAEDLQQAAPFR